MDTDIPICFVGDTHGVRDRMEDVIAEAGRLRARVIIQVGDFGIWPEMRHSRPQTSGFERDVADMLERHGVGLLLFVDGNHEWHPWLASLRTKRGRQSATVPVENTERVHWMPRGSRIKLFGLTFLFCGGAPSIDRDLRVHGQSWWPEEAITDEDVIKSGVPGKVDVLVAHDASELCEIPGITDDWEPGISSRRKVETIRAIVKPRWAFSGHYHKRITQDVSDGLSTTRWEILGCESNPISEHMITLDVATLQDSTDRAWAVSQGL